MPRNNGPALWAGPFFGGRVIRPRALCCELTVLFSAAAGKRSRTAVRAWERESCMKALVLFVFVAVAQGFSAQETQSPTSRPNPDSASQTATQPADKKSEYSPGVGTIIVAELTNSVNAKKAKIGDRVECTVVTDLLYQGKI